MRAFQPAAAISLCLVCLSATLQTASPITLQGPHKQKQAFEVASVRLEKVSVDYLIIDHVDKIPTEN